jgi:hypothetical protein
MKCEAYQDGQQWYFLLVAENDTDASFLKLMDDKIAFGESLDYEYKPNTNDYYNDHPVEGEFSFHCPDDH